MTPAARLSAAIDLLDAILGGQPAGMTLTNWGRQSRFAGSRDRAAVRDIVFDCIRLRRSFEHISGDLSGRGLVLAYAGAQEPPLLDLFTGEKFAPDPLLPDEAAALADVSPMSDPVRLNYPDFLDTALKASLGADFEAVMQAFQSRAPVDLRVNLLKGTVAEAQAALKADDILTVPVEGVPTALRVTDNHRRVAGSSAYLHGLVEIQDASSQAAAWFSNVAPDMQVLDYCAGGGGKALALFDGIKGQGRVVAHDIATVRMNDLPVRASRAGARIQVAHPGHPALKQDHFDLVFVDAPCSGSGSWRRTPDAKWRISQSDIDALVSVQASVLDQAAQYVRQGGVLTYATCSILKQENMDQIGAFIERNDVFECEDETLLTPVTCGDGFYAARLRRRG